MIVSNTNSTMHQQMGCSVIEALHQKYRDDEPLDFVICVPKSAPGKVAGELMVPTNLILNQANIAWAGDEDQLRKLCCRVKELDLADNHLTEWTQVFAIINCIPDLSFLNLSGNQIGESAVVFSGITYPKLVRLVLNKTLVTWNVVCDLMECIPHVRELHLSLNGMKEVDPLDHTKYCSVTTLYLNDNEIRNWDEIMKIGTVLPNLEHLVMINNPIDGIPDDLLEEFVQEFTSLQSLNISKSMLSSWNNLEKLRWFPSLRDIRIQETPLWLENEEKFRRQLAIGYLPNISKLNGSSITEIEREDAERAFIRHYMDNPFKSNRYIELEARYGKLDPLVNVTMDRNDMVSVTVHFNNKSVISEVDVKWTVPELKTRLKDIVGTEKMRVYYRDVGGPMGDEELLKHSRRKLSSYNVKEGDQLFIDM